MTGRDDTSSHSVGQSLNPSLVSGVLTLTLMIKLKNMKRRSRASPANLENEQNPKKQKRLRFRKASSSSFIKTEFNKTIFANDSMTKKSPANNLHSC